MSEYFIIICSDPMDLSPLGGEESTREERWAKIRKEDADVNPSSSLKLMMEQYDEYERARRRAFRVRTALLTFDAERALSCEVLEELNVGLRDDENIRTKGEDVLKGLVDKMERLKVELEKRERPTMKECAREMAFVNKYSPVTMSTTLFEYRGAQALVKEIINGQRSNNPNY